MESTVSFSLESQLTARTIATLLSEEGIREHKNKQIRSNLTILNPIFLDGEGK